MFRQEQKAQEGLPKEMKKLVPFLKLLTQSTMENQFKKIWEKKTRVLDNPTKNSKKIKQLQTPQTKKIFYKDRTVYSCLQDIIEGKTNKEFIKWYKTKYYIISLKDLGIFK
jgi:hypothetical protein